MSKGTLVCIVVLSVTSAVVAEESQDEKFFRKSIAHMEKFVKVLEQVQDEQTAKEAKTVLEQLYIEGIKQTAVLRKLPLSTRRAWQSKYEKRFEAIQKGSILQMRRIEEIPDAREVLQDVFPFNRDRRSLRIKAVRVQLGQIEQALRLYRLAFDTYPKTLRTLTVKRKDKAPFLEIDTLTDPWGNPYQYDPTGPKNKGEKPDLWSGGPPNEDESIGNWLATEK